MNRANETSTQIKTADRSITNCLWMDAGVVDYKLCDRNYDCEHCPLDQALHGEHARLPSEGTTLHVQGCEFAPDRFYNPGHLWMRIEERGEVRLGLDDFAQRLVGHAYSLTLPSARTQIKRGECCGRLVLQSGIVSFFSPVTLTVKETNASLLRQPSLLNRSPYGQAWLMLAEPKDLESCLKTALFGNEVKPWLAGEIEKLQLLVNSFTTHSNQTSRTMNDGGALTKEFLKGLSVEETRRVISSFFSLSTEVEAENKLALLVPERR
jgi:glycine cleavage system H protein